MLYSKGTYQIWIVETFKICGFQGFLSQVRLFLCNFLQFSFTEIRSCQRRNRPSGKALRSLRSQQGSPGWIKGSQ